MTDQATARTRSRRRARTDEPHDRRAITSPQNLPSRPIPEGHVSVRQRVVVPPDVAEWWASLDSHERGDVLTAVHRKAG